MWYHGTKEKQVLSIKKDGFKLPNEDNFNRFGKGVYFSDSVKEAERWGMYITEADIPSSKIYKMNYIDLEKLYPGLSIEEEEGVPKLEEYIKKLGYPAVSLKYDDGTTELVVYDTNIITIQSITERKQDFIDGSEAFEHELKRALKEES